MMLPAWVILFSLVGAAAESKPAAAAKPAVATPAAKPAATAAAATPAPKTLPAAATKPAPAASTKTEAAKPATDAKKTDKPTTVKAKKQTLRVEVALDGVFEAVEAAEVVLRAEEWIEFPVLRAVEHGTRVKAGDVLVEFDTEKIDRAIADLKRDHTTTRIALTEAEINLQAARASAPLDLAAAERASRNAAADLDYFLKTDRPVAERSANFMVRVSEDYLAYEQEELRQLEKMYKADDLTEETEEIILKRARDSVARAAFSLERMKVERDQMLKTTLPRAEELFKSAAQRQSIDEQKFKQNQPLGQRRLELALEKLKIDFERSQRRLERLEADRRAMDVKAPVAGILYHGRAVRGKWVGGELLAEKLRRGGRLSADEVFMTVVSTRPLAVRASVSEKHWNSLSVGLKGLATPAALPAVRLDCEVERLGAAPTPGKEFDVRLSLKVDAAVPLVPGMTCDVKLVPVRKTDVLTVPLAAVSFDDDQPRQQVVYLPAKTGKPTKKPVTLGQRSDKLVEVLSGLAEGEEILAETPKEK